MRTVDVYGIDGHRVCVKGLGSNRYYDCSCVSPYAGSFLLEGALASLRIHCIYDGLWTFHTSKASRADPVLVTEAFTFYPGSMEHPLGNGQAAHNTAYLRLQVPDDTVLIPEGEFAGEDTDDQENEERFTHRHTSEDD